MVSSHGLKPIILVLHSTLFRLMLIVVYQTSLSTEEILQTLFAEKKRKIKINSSVPSFRQHLNITHRLANADELVMIQMQEYLKERHVNLE